MALDYSTALRNGRLQQIQTTVGSAGLLKIFSGAEPANCAAADPSGLLVTINLPTTFLTVSGGVTTIAGTWTGTATGSGTAQCFRMYDNGSNCHLQGAIPAEMTLSPSAAIVSGQSVTVNTFGVTAGNP
jgi:hypothetical protein